MIDFFKKNKKYIHSVLFLSTYGKFLCANEETDKEEKKEYKFTKDVSGSCFKEGSNIYGNFVANSSLKTKDIFNKNLENLIYIKPNVELTGGLFFDFNKGDSDDIYKKLTSSAKLVLLNCNFVGTFIKNGINGIQDVIYIDNLKISYSPVEKQLNDNLSIKNTLDLNYGSSEYVKNDDLRVIELRDTVELKTNLGGQEFKFDPSLGLVFNSDNSLQVIEILKKTGNFALTRVFTSSNLGVAKTIIPGLGVKCNVDHELFNGGLKAFFDFKTLINSNFKFDILLDFGWKKDLSIVKNLKGNFGVGFDSDMSYYFSDKVDFTEQFKNSEDNYLLFRPQLFNFNVSLDIDYTSLLKNVDKLWFVSEVSTSADVKVEYIFGLTVDNFGQAKDVEDLGNGFYLNITLEALKTKLNGSNIENEKVKFLLDNLKLDIFKISGGCSPKSLKVDTKNIDSTKFEGLGFDLGVTAVKGEFEWAKYGLTFNASILGDSFGCKGGKLKWKDILSVGAKWDFAKFWENRNN